MMGLYLKRSLLVIVLCLVMMGSGVAISLSVPENTGTKTFDKGDTDVFSFVVNGDDKAQSVEIFMEVPNGLLTFDGKEVYSETVNLAAYESHSVVVLLKAVNVGVGTVTYGVRYGSASGGSIGFKQVSKGSFAVRVYAVNTTPQITPKKTSGGGGGGGGSIGTVGVTVQNSSKNVIIPKVDASPPLFSQDVTGDGAGVDVGVVPTQPSRTDAIVNSDGGGEVSSVEKRVEGKSVVLLVVILAAVTMLLAGITLKIGKGALS